jgi:hypothetical protein
MVSSLNKNAIAPAVNIKHRGLAVAFAVAALFAAQAASADTVNTIELKNWWGGHGSATITFSGVDYHDGVTYKSFTESGGAGGFLTYDLTTNPHEYPTNSSFQSWCVDIFHDFNFVTSSSDTKQNASQIFVNLGTTKSAKIQKDLTRLYAAEHTLIDSHSSTNTNSAAFQLAVWEIVNEKSTNPYDLASGNLKISSGSTGYALAEGWLTALNNLAYEPNPKYTVSFWNVNDGNGGASGSHPPPTGGAQDVAVFSPVPEPGTYAMMLAGLGLMGFIARRRRERDAV